MVLTKNIFLEGGGGGGGGGARGTKSLKWQGAFHLERTHLGGVGGVKPPIHFHCVLHAKRGGGVQKAC